MHGLILLLGLLVFASGKGYVEMSSSSSETFEVSCLYPDRGGGCPDYSKSDESSEDSEDYKSDYESSEEIQKWCDPAIYNCYNTKPVFKGTGRAPDGGYQRVGAPGGYLGAWAQPGVPAHPYIGTAGDPGFGYPAVGAPGGYLGAWAPPAAPGNLPGGILGRIFGVAPGGRPGGIPGGIPGVAPGGAPAPPVVPKVDMWLQAMDQDNSGHIDMKELGQALANGMGHFSVDRLEGNAANTRNWKRK